MKYVTAKTNGIVRTVMCATCIDVLSCKKWVVQAHYIAFVTSYCTMESISVLC